MGQAILLSTKNRKMIHVVFQEPDIDILQQAIRLDESLNGDVLIIRDDLAVGPIKEILSEEGIKNRLDWWRTVLSGSELDGKADDGMLNDREVVEQLVSKLLSDPEETAWIWAAPNKHDVCGYYWLISH